MCYISQSFFQLPKSTIRNNTSKFILFKQTLRDIVLLFHYIGVLDMNLQNWKELCPKVLEKEYDNLQIDRFAIIGEGKHTIRNCNKKTAKECTPEIKPFQFDLAE